MRKVLFLILFLALCVNVEAANKVATFGAPDSTDVYALEAKDDGVVYFRDSGGINWGQEELTANHTITAQEAGKTFIVDCDADCTLTLPDADVGMELTFIAVDGAGDNSKEIILDPQSTDFIRGIDQTGPSSFSAGDSLKSAGDTGDAITLFVGEDLYWDVKEVRGTWVDND